MRTIGIRGHFQRRITSVETVRRSSFQLSAARALESVAVLFVLSPCAASTKTYSARDIDCVNRYFVRYRLIFRIQPRRGNGCLDSNVSFRTLKNSPRNSSFGKPLQLINTGRNPVTLESESFPHSFIMSSSFSLV